MKYFILSAAVSLAFLGTSRALAQDTTDPVTIERDRILVPGSKFSEKDQRDLNAILAQYDKSLYKLKGYEKGKVTRTNGTLKNSLIDRATAARDAVHAKDPHFTGSTLQIGFTTNQDISGRTANQDAGRTSNQDVTTLQNRGASANIQSVRDEKRNRELVKRLTPILRKYTRTHDAR
jgi:hypothetical protein